MAGGFRLPARAVQFGGWAQEDDQLHVSVVVAAYSLDRWDSLLAAMASVAAQTVRPVEAIVVVDHNPELLARAATALPAAVVVANGNARGLSGARNAGLACASGEVVAFLDDDAVAAPDWLERLLETYATPAVLGAGGRIVPRWVAGRRPRWFPEEFDWVVGCSYRGMPTATAPVRNLIGANMSYRRDAMIGVGGFREGIGRVGRRPLGCEETELGIRILQRHAGTVLYVPAARVDHVVPASRTTVRYFLSRCFAEGLSKAIVARSVGTASGLSTERAYTLRTLPTGVLAGLRDGIGGDGAGVARAGAIAAGFATTAAGYAVGRLRPAAA